MNNILQYLSTTIPVVATICNIFLFSTLLTAKKNGAVKSMMFLLFSCVLWTSGSAFMRMNVYPGMEFWWTVSLIGLFLVPYFYFIVVCAFTDKHGFILKLIFGAASLAVAILNVKDLFLTVPEVTSSGGITVLKYGATNLAYIPVILSAVILLYSWVILLSGTRRSGIPSRQMRPFTVGVILMAVGVGLDMVPIFNPLPMDTLACAFNVICVYVAFCRRHLYPVHQITSRGAMYVVSLGVTSVIALPVYRLIYSLTGEAEKTVGKQTIFITVLCAALSILCYLALNRLNEKVFVKDKTRKEDGLKKFSKTVNATLNENDIISSFISLMREEIGFDRLFMCMKNAETGTYELYNCPELLELPITLSEGTPLIEYLMKIRRGASYADFSKSNEYRSMWESEKQLLKEIGASYVLPFFNEESVMGIAIFSLTKEEKYFTFDQANFLDSVAAVAAIALKNAHLYSSLEKEAQCDTLTELYNRRTFNKKLNEIVANGSMSPVSLIMFNLDDFSLFNELYGNEEGDNVLIRFAGLMTGVFGSKGVLCRYSGKEFAALLPTTDAATAADYANRVKSRLQHQIDEEAGKAKKFLTFSAGVCSYPDVASNAAELVSFANLAVFHIKQDGKNQIRVYSVEMNEKEDADKASNIHELTSTIYALTAAVDAKDHYTFNHSRAVSTYATQLARCAGFQEDMVEIVRQAGLLHDIGKIGIPDAILTKAGRLNDEEYARMKKHPELSIEMIRHLPNLDYVIPAVIGHHERYDGKGYPRGLAGEEIPVGARVLTIADSFDAMVSRRAYKDKMPVETAVGEILKNLGTQFDPELGTLFAEKIQTGEIEICNY